MGKSLKITMYLYFFNSPNICNLMAPDISSGILIQLPI